MKIKADPFALRNDIKNYFLQIHAGASVEEIKQEMKKEELIQERLDILRVLYELKSQEQTITMEEIEKFFMIYQAVTGISADELTCSNLLPPSHPISIFTEENQALLAVLHEISVLMEKTETHLDQDIIENLQGKMDSFGQFYNHYNRKEKIIFPLLERYGHYSLSRIMWGDDDRIRNLYKGTKSMIKRLSKIEFYHIKNTFDHFAERFKEMVLDEEMFLLPIAANHLTEADWQAVAIESEAFGYAIIAPLARIKQDSNHPSQAPRPSAEPAEEQHIPFGGGYLTLKEANIILNNLPVEITFVDKHDIFKYYNDRIEASDMMLIRTPSSIGRNVANCHPPNSLKKVMRLIRELKTGKKPIETMWYKRDDKYIHITYKAVFDDMGEYVGILEYVQDIQPFLDLPRQVKRELSE